MIEFGKLKRGDVVAITAASSSVGLAAIQMVNDAGGVSIAITRKADKRERLIEAGAHYTHPVSHDAHDVILATSMMTPMAMRSTILMRDMNYLPLYQALRVPILLIHAKDDDIVLPAAAEELHAVRPDAKYVLYDTGAHAPHWENAEPFNRELANFVGAIA